MVVAISRRLYARDLALAGLGALIARTSAATAATAVPDAAWHGHLLRRAGFGPGLDGTEPWSALGWDGAVDRLVGYETTPNDALDDRLARSGLNLDRGPDLQAWWLLRMAHTARPLEEKMTLFWHGLLTSSLASSRPPDMLLQNQFLREHALDSFRVLLTGIARTAAMMRWLDIASNRKGHPNENYAREQMELFTMGVGNYSEEDVRESARALTGLRLQDGSGVFDPRAHDAGPKTILGRTGRFGPDDVVSIILDQPATASYLARRLLQFFLAPVPSSSAIESVAASLRATDYSVKAALSALFRLPAFREPTAFRALVKSPVEYAIGLARQLGLTNNFTALASATRAMGQELLRPPNVAGWRGGQAWLNSSTWLARLNTANALTTQRRQFALEIDAALGAAPPDAALERLVGIMLDGVLGDEQRAVLAEFAGGDAAEARDRWWDGRGRGLVYLISCLSDYHLA